MGFCITLKTIWAFPWALDIALPPHALLTVTQNTNILYAFLYHIEDYLGFLGLSTLPTIPRYGLLYTRSKHHGALNYLIQLTLTAEDS